MSPDRLGLPWLQLCGRLPVFIAVMWLPASVIVYGVAHLPPSCLCGCPSQLPVMWLSACLRLVTWLPARLRRGCVVACPPSSSDMGLSACLCRGSGIACLPPLQLWGCLRAAISEHGVACLRHALCGQQLSASALVMWLLASIISYGVTLQPLSLVA